jgi:hypothetical protein
LFKQASKKIEDAKLARDFQTTLQEFQKVQQLASERETTYTPAASTSLPTRSAILCIDVKLIGKIMVLVLKNSELFNFNSYKIFIHF